MSAARFRGRPSTGEGAPAWGLARAVRATVGTLLLAVYRTRFIGGENVPASGAILAGNHASYLDPALLW